MKYSLSKIIHNLVRNGLLYLFILLSFMLGAGLFITCMNFRMTGEQLLEEAKIQSSEGLIQVLGSFHHTANPLIDPEAYQQEKTDYLIPYNTYLNLISNPQYTDELEFLFTFKTVANIHIWGADEGADPDVYFMNEDLFDYLYGFSRSEGMAYLGDTAYAELLHVGDEVKNEKDILFVNSTIYIDGDSLIVDDQSYPYEVVMPMEADISLTTLANTLWTDILDKEMESILGEETKPDTMDNAVILPIEDVFIPPNTDILSNHLLLHYRNAEWREDVVAQVIQELNRIDSRSHFSVENRYLDLKGQMEDYSYDMDRWLLVAVSILFLSGVGCIGSMYLLLDKRRHFMAVSIAYGSTFWRIMLETVTELLLVLFTGSILGVLILPLLQKITVYQGALRVNVGGIGIVAITVVAFSVISVSLGMHAVRIKDVAAVLKEE